MNFQWINKSKLIIIFISAGTSSTQNTKSSAILESIVLGIYLCFKIYFLIDTNTKILTEITDLVVLGRNYWSSCRVQNRQQEKITLDNYQYTSLSFLISWLFFKISICFIFFSGNPVGMEKGILFSCCNLFMWLCLLLLVWFGRITTVGNTRTNAQFKWGLDEMSWTKPFPWKKRRKIVNVIAIILC